MKSEESDDKSYQKKKNLHNSLKCNHTEDGNFRADGEGWGERGKGGEKWRW